MLYGEVRTGGWTLQGWGSGLDAVRRCDRLPAVQLAVIGGGRMGEALVAGLLRAGWDPEGIGVSPLRCRGWSSRPCRWVPRAS
jgi:hypothetical protein